MDIPKIKILKRMGYHMKKGILTDTLNRLIDEETMLSKKLIMPKKIIRSELITGNSGDGVVLAGGFRIASKHIARLLKNADTAFGFAVTIGKLLEEKRNVYMQAQEESRSLILDSIGSVAVEELAEETHNEIRGLITGDRQTATRRFSPGYGDWSLESQPSFLQWLEAKKIGIQISERYIMCPEKSISAILGIQKISD